MLRTETPDKPFQRQFELSSAIKPGAMDPVAGPIDVAAPNTLETEQDIAAKLGAHLFQFIGKSDRRFRVQARDQSEWPLGGRPVIRRHKLHVMSGSDHTAGEAF